MSVTDIFKKKRIPTDDEVMQMGVLGRKLNVNPSSETTLARLEGRLKRVTQFLKSGKGTEEKRVNLERTQKRLQIEIILRKGEL
jgi:hypothetical protein